MLALAVLVAILCAVLIDWHACDWSGETTLHHVA